jgi:hypothetical protein
LPGHLVAWDCFNGATREPDRREFDAIDGQIFILLEGFDHLAGQRLDDPAAPASSPTPAPPRPALPDRGEFFSTLTWLDTLYRTQLGRHAGVDLEGIAAHVFDTYLQARLGGASVEDAKVAVVTRINDIVGRTDIHV